MHKHGDIINMDALSGLKKLSNASVHCCVTSPPYWGLRDYGHDGQIGLEPTPQGYVDALLPVFAEVARVLRPDGTLWLNLGDSYIGYHGNNKAGNAPSPSDKAGYRENMRKSSVGVNGLKNKDLAGIPWRMAFALQDAGWYLRCDCIWAKPNPMPESVTDRPTRCHEYLFLFSRSPRYYYDHKSTREPTVAALGGRKQGQTALTFSRKVNEGIHPNNNNQHREGRKISKREQQNSTRNRRSVWTVPTRPMRHAHFATFPPDLIRPCIIAGCPEGGIVLDPFFGAGTVGVVCLEERRRYLGIEINPNYIKIAQKRINESLFAQRQLFLQCT